MLHPCIWIDIPSTQLHKTRQSYVIMSMSISPHVMAATSSERDAILSRDQRLTWMRNTSPHAHPPTISIFCTYGSPIFRPFLCHMFFQEEFLGMWPFYFKNIILKARTVGNGGAKATTTTIVSTHLVYCIYDMYVVWPVPSLPGSHLLHLRI